MGVFDFFGNVAQGILNYASQSETNDANYEINQMNNAFNERMMDKQFGYNVQLMDKQNKYNSASEQVKRLREAGLNPALALGHVASGSATSAQPNPTSSAHANGNATMVAPQFHGLSDALNFMLQRDIADADIANKQEDTKSKQINNEYLRLMRMQELQNLINMNRDKGLDIEMKQIQKSMYSDMLNEQFNSLQLQNKQTEQAIQMSIFQTLMLEKQFNVFDTDFKINLSLKAAQIQQAIADGKLKENQATTEIFKWLESQEKTRGLKISNDLNYRMADDIVRNQKYVTMRARQNVGSDNPFQMLDNLKRAYHGRTNY